MARPEKGGRKPGMRRQVERNVDKRMSDESEEDLERVGNGDIAKRSDRSRGTVSPRAQDAKRKATKPERANPKPKYIAQRKLTISKRTD